MDVKKNNPAVRRKILRWFRNIVQLMFFIFSPALFTQSFGGVKEIFVRIGAGESVSWSAFTVRLAFLCGITVVFGRIFCGWACSFGALGDYLYQISAWVQKRCGKKLPAIPEKAYPYLKKLKYLVLTGIILLCFFGKNEWITEYSPWTVFSRYTALNISWGGMVLPLIIFHILLLGMLWEERFFCKFLCPMGAVFSLLPEVPFLQIRRKEYGCISGCNACKKNCPVNIKLQENVMEDGECIRCGRCTAVCPKGNLKLGQQSEKPLEEILEKMLEILVRIC